MNGDAQHIGELGESTLRLWCSQRGIAAHKSEPDRTGWDFLLEFPATRPTIFPLIQPVMMQCFVQVKSTNGTRRRISLDLERWKNLATSPIPAFFLVFEFDQESEPQRAFLVHLDTSYVEKFLKAHIAGQKTLTLTYGDDKVLPEPTGESFEEAVRRLAGNSIELYMKEKLEFLRTAGFGDVYGEFNFEPDVDALDGLSFREYLLDLSIGLRENLKLSSANLFPRRFNITSSESILPVDGGYLSLSVQALGDASVRIFHDEALIFCHEMEVFLPQGLGDVVDDNFFKLRLVRSPIEIIVAAMDGSMRSKTNILFLSISESMPFTSLRKAAELYRAMSLLAAENRDGRLEVDFQGRTYSWNWTPLDRGFDNSLSELFAAIENVAKIFKACDIVEEPPLSLLELLGQGKRFDFAREVLLKENTEVKVSFCLGDSLDLKMQACMPCFIQLAMGRLHLRIVFCVWGELKLIESGENKAHYEIVTSDLRLERHEISQMSGKFPLTEKQIVEGLERKYGSYTNFLINPHYGGD
jgi:hypothetical protein